MPASGKALLFDIDGTLTDTDALHLEAFNEVLGPHGMRSITPRFTQELQAFQMPRSVSGFYGPAPERQAYYGRKGTGLRTLVAGKFSVARPDGAACAGDREMFRWSRTNAPRLNAELLLSGRGIAERSRSSHRR